MLLPFERALPVRVPRHRIACLLLAFASLPQMLLAGRHIGNIAPSATNLHAVADGYDVCSVDSSMQGILSGYSTVGGHAALQTVEMQRDYIKYAKQIPKDTKYIRTSELRKCAAPAASPVSWEMRGILLT